jgi:Membrane-associated lipoprotein involved in thiamine biosynthesis
MNTEERIVDVMGTTAHIIVTDGATGLADRAVEMLDALEARWSRFRSDSEISMLNDRPGVPVLVSRDTYELVERAIDGWRLTEGRYDPTLLRELRAAGYDRSFKLVAASDAARGTPSHATDANPSNASSSRAGRSGVEQITLDPIVGTVMLGPGVEIDPGGIGKGLAADLVVGFLLAEGARGALVSVGGDLRAEGAAPEGTGWIVAIADPAAADRVIDTIGFDAGAVASTWRTKRVWTAADGTPRHHLIDPTTGLPAASGLAGVTVVTARGWQAEVLAKAAFLAGPVEGAALLEANHASGLLVADDGSLHEAGAWAQFRAA